MNQRIVLNPVDNKRGGLMSRNSPYSAHTTGSSKLEIRPFLPISKAERILIQERPNSMSKLVGVIL